MIGRLYPARSAVPVEYGRALAQRNASLRRIRAGLSSREALAPWDASLVHAACELDAIRGEAVTALGPLFHEMGERLGLPGSTLEYEPSPISDDSLVSRLDRDLERGTTGAGPHLAELAISAAGRDLRAFGSQGEQRLAVLALLLAEAHLLGAVRGDPPLLLLDDVLSELDDDRRAALLASAPVGSQALVTATTLRAFPASAPQPDQIVDVVPGKATSR
jgi:DNA replication and repair protein RecF